MSRFFVGLALWALLLALAACGGDSKGTDPKDAELAEMVDTVVSTYDDLTVCTDKREGTTAYVEDEKKAYVCDGDDWTEDGSLTNEIRSDSEKKSSNGKSSSSGKNNPSSPVASSCKIETEDNCEYGTLTDDRDGQTYKTVKIGEQWWMAENLNYRYIQQTYNGGVKDSSSYCYSDDPANCAKYGRLYLWSAAMDSAGIIPGNSANGCGYEKDCNLGNVKVRGVCPEGWHLPDTTEWNALFNAVGGKETAGIMLKSTEGWKDKNDGTSGNGSDNFGFSALPAGYREALPADYRDGRGVFYYEGLSAFFWSFTEYNSNYAYHMYLDRSYDNAGLDNSYKSYGFSVRCLKDYESGSEKKSSNGKSSSSDEKNSSSSSVVPTVSLASPCKTATEDNCEYGTLTDDRDGQTYKTVKIGEQWWMAENLNYRYIQQTAEEDSSSFCYNDDPANCAKYGRLYLWSAAMDSAGIIPGNSANGCGYEKDCNLGNVKVRGVCPEGWHLPDTTEWNALFDAVGGGETAGKMLKSTEGWEDNGDGSDSYSFSALPAGYRDDNGDFRYEGSHAYFWSSTEDGSYYAYYVSLYYDDVNAYLYSYYKYYGYSVRCLRD